jgi:hypothetical protein
MTDTTAKDTEDEGRVVAGRGPAYPYLSLGKAVERAEAIRDANMTRVSTKPIGFYKVWGYKGDTGPARQTMAALNHFGLLEYAGRGDAREVRLSDLARRIVQDKVPNSPERRKALAEAAVKPTIHGKLFEAYPPPLPPDVVLETFLTRDCDFSETAAKNAITNWRDTLDYIGLVDPANIPSAAKPSEKDKPTPKVGDLVQWTSAGVDQFPAPKRIRAIQEDWAFVEGSETGVPMSELNVTAAAAPGAVVPPTLALPEAAQQSLAAKEQELLRGPLSRDTSYRLIVSGKLGPKELGKLIKLLEAQKTVFDDEEEGAE